MTARLRGLTLAALIGYGLAWADRAYGHTPIAVFLLVAAAAWTAGWMTAAVPLFSAPDGAWVPVDQQEGTTLLVPYEARLDGVGVRVDTHRCKR